ncbi:hypothetical protein ACFVUS_33275 [Nocardia sp. NPDC058058]|uniref:hypothetical protein n=1 Tax=Nocardia sp. NPDC058058 TaxID=3346317 RepID=UPI0036DC1DE9
MVEQQALGTRLTRAFGLFTLLAGIAIMHAVVIGMGGGSGEMSHMGSGTHTTAPLPADMSNPLPADMSNPLAAAMPEPVTMAVATPLTMSTAHEQTMPGCGGDCDGHAGLHGCVFVLTALLLALGLALLGWFGVRQRETAATKVRGLPPHRARPPPWTVPSLAELAILRI